MKLVKFYKIRQPQEDSLHSWEEPLKNMMEAVIMFLKENKNKYNQMIAKDQDGIINCNPKEKDDFFFPAILQNI